MHNYYFSDYVDSDDEDPPIEHCYDDGGPPQDQDPGKDNIGALEDQIAGPGPVRIPHSSNCAIGMDKAMQLSPAALFMCLQERQWQQTA